MNLSKEELITFVTNQKKIFDIVQIIDVSTVRQYVINDNGDLKEEPYNCYKIWNKSKRCENCTSAKAFGLKSKLTKFEFVENEVYFVLSVYIEIEDVPYVIEMISKLNSETVFGAFGKDKLIKFIKEQNKKLYIDALTGAYNRYYYYEQLMPLSHINSVVMIDADNFKHINDTYGHSTGDFVLKEIVKVISSYIRDADAVIRWGGDEFLIVFLGISKNGLKERLEGIRQTVSEIHNDKFPELKASISMGAVYSNKSAAALIDLDIADKALYEAKKQKNSIVIRDL